MTSDSKTFVLLVDVVPAAAPLAQVNPLAAYGGHGLMKLFSTHPPTAERVAALLALTGAS